MPTPRILVAEDETLIGLDLQHRLSKLGYEVPAVVPSGEEAVCRAAGLKPDLLLMDVHLQGAMDGIEAATKIRSFCDIPVVYLTANADALTLDRARLSEAASYLLKPYRERELQISIEMALSNHALQRELRTARRELEERVRQRTAELDAANVALQREIRERQHAVQTASEWKQRYELIVASSGQAVYEVDLTQNSLVWGAGVERVLGHPVSSLSQSPDEWAGLIHPDDRAVTLGNQARARTIGSPFAYHYRFRHGNGNYLWIYDRGLFLRNPEGRVVRMLGMMQDVTHRKITEDRVREQATLLDHSQDAIMVSDLEGRIVFWNAAAERTYAWSLEEALGRPLQDVFGNLGPELELAHRSTLERGEWSGEVRLLNRYGQLLIAQSRWTLMRDEQGAPRAFLVANTDLTEKKQLEAKFLRAQRLESIGALASGIAHDLNNVFTPILMASQLLEGRVTPGTERILQLLQASTRRGSEMVKQVLSFSRGLASEPALIQLSHLIREMERMARDTFPPTIQVQSKLAGELWPVRGESTPLYQVLMNLCINARDAMPSGGVLSLQAANCQIASDSLIRHPHGKPGPHVRVSVSDTGTGMSPEVLNRIFEPFFTTKAPESGTGLGLSTVLEIIKAHQGWVEVDTTPGSGSTFHVYLPAQSQQSAAAAADQATPPEGKGELLLVVDDEAAIREILKTMLHAHGYEVLAAADGSQAIVAFEANRYRVSLVLTDWMMPGLDGAATIHALRQLDPNVPVLVLSGLAEKEKLAHFLAGKGIPLLTKPYSARALLTAVHQLLQHAVPAVAASAR